MNKFSKRKLQLSQSNDSDLGILLSKVSNRVLRHTKCKRMLMIMSILNGKKQIEKMNKASVMQEKPCIY